MQNQSLSNRPSPKRTERRSLFQRWIAVFALLAILGNSLTRSANACPFCSAVSQTLRQEMEIVDVSTIAKLVRTGETETEAIFEIIEIIKGDSLVKVGDQVTVSFFGTPEPDQKFLLIGVDPPQLLWSAPQKVSDGAIEYVRKLAKMPTEVADQLVFFLNHLESEDRLIAADAHDEMAIASYNDIKAQRDTIDREKLRRWISSDAVPMDRKRLYLVLLGIKGDLQDAEYVENLLKIDDVAKRPGLDALISCYLSIQGEKALDLIDQRFIANKSSPFSDTYAAVMALRFHGTEETIVPRERILKSMHLVLDRPELADSVINDLARWEDWSQIEKLVGMFKAATDDNSSWVRMPIINYLRACPLPEAQTQLEVLKEIDPAVYKRATTFFPIPKPAAGTSDSSQWPSTSQSPNVDPLEMDLSESPARTASSIINSLSQNSKNMNKEGESLDSLETLKPLAYSGPLEPFSTRTSVLPPNLTTVVSVIGMLSMSIWISMWLLISGAGQHGILYVGALHARKLSGTSYLPLPRASRQNQKSTL